MRKWIWFVLTLSFFWVCPVAARAVDDEFQAWNTTAMDFKIDKKHKIMFQQQVKWSDNPDRFYYYHFDAGLGARLNSWFDLGIAYRKISTLEGADWKHEDRPYVDGAFRWRWANFLFSDRNRLEYRVREDRPDQFRYRNKLTLKFPFEWTSLKIRPYAANEIFVVFDDVDLNQNRAFFGFEIKPVRFLKLNLYYFLQSQKTSSNNWVDHNVFALDLKFLF